MGRSSFRNKLLSSGVATVQQRGFSTVGVREITATAGVAQGSFTNHFSSKEAFGVAVLDGYFEQLRAEMKSTLENETVAPTQRLRAYFSRIADLFQAADFHYGCLAGNMALKASEHSELIRNRLGAVFTEWTSSFASVIWEAQQAGEMPPDLDAGEVGAALLESWHGAILRMKVDRSPASLVRFQRFTLPALLNSNAVQIRD